MGLELRAIQSPIFSEPFDFTFHAQAFTLLVGSSGSGKSSLFQVIAQVSSLPYSGQVLIDGSEVSQLSIIARVQKVGILFQNPNHQFTMENLFEELIFTLENIGYHLQEIDSKIAEVVQQCRCEAILHRPIHHLSGGEKQKAALAVLFAMNPRVYLLDEPFASIDRKSRIEILEILKELALDGKTVILCDHDLSDYKAYIDHMVELRDGKLREVFQIPSYEMTQVASKEVASSPELFQLLARNYSIWIERLVSLEIAPSFRLLISHSIKGFPVSWVTMVSGNQPSFGLFFNFKSIRGALHGRGQS